MDNGQILDVEIRKLFTEIRLIEEQKGYEYLVYAVKEYYHDASYSGQIYHKLFDDVAHHFQTSSDCIERNIRHVLECTWTREYTSAMYDLYDCVIRREGGRPSAANFIKQSVHILEERLD